ncbi:MAG: dTDP-4-amino-4,6-dideoxygalactose transaminase [Candidatus Delongbacteria bacterium]|jgi:dTDP-4-amino-4,6-dideoxygalactose transaminase|nr:dTDP-4-amino-4,6-dideoxygalactose transaminase [Candidatus Delongbacteria bacterium]
MKIPFNKPIIYGTEKNYLEEVFKNDQFSGNGSFTKKCNKIIEDKIGTKKAILTSSCTDALEMTSLLAKIEPGDEVIMPSFTFVSTASAFELRHANIVWCDIRPDTKNIDETKIEGLITDKTKAVVVVHYAGVACEMDQILEICKKHNLLLIEDAAQAIDCKYKDKYLGTIGDLAAYSFHETKNIQCGEGGALLVNNNDLVERAEFVRDKGTNRIHFNQGKVDKYTWVELGSSYLMSELQAAFLYPQLKNSSEINNSRLESWNLYYNELSKFMDPDKLPVVPENCVHNAHMFYIVLDSFEERQQLIEYLATEGILAIFHYVSLHSSPYWKGKYNDIELPVTDQVSKTLLRLPIFYRITESEILHVVEAIRNFKKK